MSLNTETTMPADSTVPTLGKHILLAVGVAGVAVSSLMIVVVIRMRGQMRRIMNQDRPLSEITIEDSFGDHCRVGPITSTTKLFSPSDYQNPSSPSSSFHITKNPITRMQDDEISPDDTLPLSLPLHYSKSQGGRLSTSSTDEPIYHNSPRDRKISNKSTSSYARWSKWFRKSDSSDDFNSQSAHLARSLSSPPTKLNSTLSHSSHQGMNHQKHAHCRQRLSLYNPTDPQS
ncbi:hypothetical protein DFH28DRAFT_554696 [Melampsora americana]|nr:hypothetical protein DFH28DRAFT_554696 [Melampsora americana]